MEVVAKANMKNIVNISRQDFKNNINNNKISNVVQHKGGGQVN